MRELGSFADLQQDPHPEYLAVLADLVLSGSHPQIMEHFNSGIRCAVHAVDLIASSGWRLELVVKRFATEFIQEDPGAFERERRVLEILPRSEVLAPRLVWADEGEIFGVPTIVMTRLPGTPLMRVQARQPSTDSSWVRPVVRMLARIHRTPITAEDLDFLPVLDSGTVSREMLAISEDDIERRVALLPWGAEVWTTLQQYWSHAPPEDLVLVHGDFHAGNLLWHRDNIAGVIDWAGAKLGSPEYDLTHLRWETILRYDSEVVDMVRHAYEEEAGRPMPDSAIWDLTLVWRLGDAIRSWIWFFQIEGREATTLEELQERRRFLIGRALERIR